MIIQRLFASILLLSLAALPTEAQRITPVALRATDASMMADLPEPVSPLAARRDTQPVSPRTINPVGGVVGGVLGGVLGTVAGGYLGALTAVGCHGEDCGLVNAILGAGIGESIGVGLGAHVGSGSYRHENIVLTSLTSAGILVAGTVLGVAMRDAGVVMLPLTPALQLAATLAIEGH